MATPKVTKKVTLRMICDEIGISPKKARVTLRRLARNGTFAFRDEGPVGDPGKQFNYKWTFTPKQATAVKAAFAD